jgi:hypothetical protein
MERVRLAVKNFAVGNFFAVRQFEMRFGKDQARVGFEFDAAAAEEKFAAAQDT